MFIFDSQSEFFRSPQGGVKEDKPLTLKVYVKKKYGTPIMRIDKRNDYNCNLYKEIPMKWVGTEKSHDLYEASFAINEAGSYFYYFIFDESNLSPNYELLVYNKNFTTPNWIKGGIIYHIFVDRFYRSYTLSKDSDIIIRDDWGGIPNYLPIEGEIKNNDYFGGNLEGIKAKLPYLSELGITAIYLSPVFEAYSNHKYDVGDYLSIDPMFGNEQSFIELVTEAKNYGMSIILDGVFSHTGVDSVYFNKYGHYNSTGAYQSQNSFYFDWYMFNNWNNDYACWWGIKTLPTINKESKSYIDFITGENGVLKYWQKRGVKGWRLDVADELPNEFLKALRIASKNKDSESFIAGEVWEDATDKFSYGKLKEYFCGEQLDSVTNYPLRSAIIKYIENKDCEMLNRTMGFIIEKYPPQTVNCLMNILGTHDTVRILTVLGCTEIPESKHKKAEYKLSIEELKKGTALLKIASLLQFTLPGIPCIYYGDEAGVEGFEDPFNRRCFPWGHENNEILNHYKMLSQLRKYSVFDEGKYKCLTHDEGVFIFERYDKNKNIIIATNLSDKTITLNFSSPKKDYLLKISNNSFDLDSNKFLILI
ncbi:MULTISPECIES: glycoside hydrolase family 13 protein [unclassified Sedimentibacter]|uniref:glycoside hydrolase family 13 protein n=1 Tax=unclassified Sedimentibacter TaxID=2649220 RepID=UPI0027DFD1E7|nr:glycoside hydrolase family 13 protein [Sedimentibacter sp. MB35-C1]WMJ78180.1 glycoside hydrolase family 13 protein [Sedimentibacter sp. MB35-C1]